jgi:hypothetical protein
MVISGHTQDPNQQKKSIKRGPLKGYTYETTERKQNHFIGNGTKKTAKYYW